MASNMNKGYYSSEVPEQLKTRDQKKRSPEILTLTKQLETYKVEIKNLKSQLEANQSKETPPYERRYAENEQLANFRKQALEEKLELESKIDVLENKLLKKDMKVDKLILEIQKHENKAKRTKETILDLEYDISDLRKDVSEGRDKFNEQKTVSMNQVRQQKSYKEQIQIIERQFLEG